MKALLVTLGLLSSGLALAQTPPQPPVSRPAPGDVRQGLRDEANAFNKKTFEDHKADVLTRMAERAQNMKKEADCVGRAKSPEDMHACREEAHALRRDVREHFRKEQRRVQEQSDLRQDCCLHAPRADGTLPPAGKPQGPVESGSPMGEHAHPIRK